MIATIHDITVFQVAGGKIALRISINASSASSGTNFDLRNRIEPNESPFRIIRGYDLFNTSCNDTKRKGK